MGIGEQNRVVVADGIERGRMQKPEEIQNRILKEQDGVIIM